ncbi:MAG: Polyketide synthase modules and related proteins [uncultured Cytophagales bacterium]|uniref:Polyketide synthase modules and related proteins n=1 Tax=uncultured Cytophagales bacterium TaxID=158755 RepID=A0A6J4IGU3_9SPHI|nr:MAG: Polyketide synthase modules and related proteins [uncultured Cytophagales bacterium]
MGTQPTDSKALLAAAYLELKKLRGQLQAARPPVHEPIAIIGMSCRFPGAPGPEAYWELLQAGRDAIREVPGNRWRWQDFYDPAPRKAHKTYSRWGGFLDDIGDFDPAFFDISPREAVSMDPQQRLLLEVAWETFENAGYTARRLANSATGVYVGSSYNGYYRYIEPGLTQADHTAGIGNQNGILPNRVSFCFGLRGPSVLVDTLCSSSLVAVHAACQALRQGECDLALAGGVNLLLSPQYYVGMSQLKIHSPDGRCRAFDHRANGIVLGEGVGAVLLKPLSRAIADKDPILAVIRGSAVNHGGSANGLTAPNPAAHAELIGTALRNAGVSAADVSYVEAHGTGTALGDPIEIEGLTKAFATHTARKQFCRIGSVKTNIGHLEAAAGIAQLIKVVLSLNKKQLPPSLHFERPNAAIRFEDTPFTVHTHLADWQAGGSRIAGISSFGIGGANAHVIVEEAAAPAEAIAPADGPSGSYFLALSAKSGPALARRAAQLDAYLERHGGVHPADLCKSANAGRDHFGVRAGCVFGSIAELRQQLRALPEGRRVGSAPPVVAFLFTGQGAQYAGMGRQLFGEEPVFRAAVLECEAIVRQSADWSLCEVLFGDDDRIHQTQYTQPALFALAYGLAKLWASWGVKPAVMVGHSIGEYAMACLAGVFSTEDALRLVVARGRLMQALPPGSMATVFASPAQVEPLLPQYGPDLVVSAYNGPEHLVVSGRGESVAAMMTGLAARGIRTGRLRVSHAFHSPLMEPMLPEFGRVAAGVTYRLPAAGLISTVTGEAVRGEMANPAYWIDHVTAPVRFSGAVQTLLDRGVDVCLEIGPQPALTTLARSMAPDAGVAFLPGLRANAPGNRPLLEGLAELYRAGAGISWDTLYAHARGVQAPLPNYPFARSTYWITPPAPGTASPDRRADRHPFLGHPLTPVANQPGHFGWEATIDHAQYPFLGDHCIDQESIMPFSAYIEIATRAAEEVLGRPHCKIASLQLPRALVIPPDAAVRLQTLLVMQPGQAIRVEVYSQSGRRDWTLNAQATIETV